MALVDANIVKESSWWRTCDEETGETICGELDDQLQMVSELESKKKTNRAAKQIRKSRQIHEISYDKSIKKTTPFIILRQ